MAGDLFRFCFECQEASGHPDAETAEEALTGRLTLVRTAQTDASFGGREGHSGQGFLPLLRDLNSLALSALSSVPACLPASLQLV